MKTSEQIDQLATALAKAQGEFKNPPRNRAVKVAMKTGGSYTFHYTTLDCIIEMIRPAMAGNGLSFSQSVTLDSDWVIVTTRILHASGQWIEDVLPVKPDGFGPQQVGSAITYGKRYSLTALLGVASDEDDDGNLGSGHTSEEIRQSPPPSRKKKEVDAVAAEHGMTTADKLPKPPYPTALAAIERLDTVDKAVKLADWCEKEHVARRLEAKDHDDLALKITDKLFEICQTEADYEAADKLLLAFIGKMRIHDAEGTALRIKLADSKDAKLGAAA